MTSPLCTFLGPEWTLWPLTPHVTGVVWHCWHRVSTCGLQATASPITALWETVPGSSLSGPGKDAVRRGHWSLSPGMQPLLCLHSVQSSPSAEGKSTHRPTPEPYSLELISDKLYWYDCLAEAGLAFQTDMKNPLRYESGISACCNHVSKDLCVGQNMVPNIIYAPTGMLLMCWLVSEKHKHWVVHIIAVCTSAKIHFILKIITTDYCRIF